MSNETAKADEPVIYSPPMPLEKMDREESGRCDKCKRVCPVFDRTDAAVCVISSDEYAPFAAVLVRSVIANISADKNYDIVILSDDMLQRNRLRIEAMADDLDNVSVRVMDISDIIKDFHFYTWAHFTPNTYYRLLAPDLFKAYKKVIYLDSDIVVNHDVAELYATDLDGYMMAAAYDTHVVAYCTQNPPLEQREYNMKTLGLKNPEEYFQAGVSLFNVEALNKTYPSGYLIEQAASHKLRWLDQDLVNMLFQGKIKRLPNKWNVMIANMPQFIDEYYLPADLRTEYYEARLAPYAVHYVGRAIPCYTCTPDLYEYFWKYARQTVFYEILLQRMAVECSQKKAAETIDQMAQHIANLNAAIQQMQVQYNALRQEHDKMYLSYQNTFRKKVRNRLTPLFNFLLPPGSRRRASVRHLYNKLRGWE